jgi:hypothetical protein
MTYGERYELKERLMGILGRHVSEGDKDMSDHEFIMIVHSRYLKSREEYLIDPNE